MNIDKSDKWLLVSCLQKSIRKGFEDLALIYADKLYDVDKSYLIYRLSIIAIEDIGLGNIDLVYSFLSTQIKKENIEKNGGKQYILKIVSEMSNSIKDRTACDLTMLAQQKANIKIEENTDLSEIFLNDKEYIINRLFVAWKILGSKKLKNSLIDNEFDNIDLFIDLNKKLIQNEKILSIIENGYKIHREPHFIAIGLLSYIYEKEKNITVGKFKTGDFIETKFNKELLDNFWLIDGVDWHTKEGKSAIYDFCKNNSETISFLKSKGKNYEEIPHIVGELLFRNTGQSVDKRLFYPSATTVFKLANKNTSFSIQETNELKKLFNDDYKDLQENIRKKFKKPDPKFFPF